MSFLSTLNIVGSGMTAQQQRLDVISENITNASTTRTEAGGPYRRKVVVMESQGNFRAALERAQRRSEGAEPVTGGVAVTGIVEDQSDFKLVFDPTHPDANEAGYVELPNVDMVKEMADAMAASQAFSADVTVFNTLKTVIEKGLQIGR